MVLKLGFVDGLGGTAANISGTGIVASVYDFYQVRGTSLEIIKLTIMDELQIKSGFDTFDDFTPPTTPFTY